MNELKDIVGIKFADEDDINSIESLEAPLESSPSTGSQDSITTRGSQSTRAIFSKWDSNDDIGVSEEDGEGAFPIQEVEPEESTSSDSSNTTFFDPDPEEIISAMEAIGVISVLEDSVDQLHILGLANPEATSQPEILYRSLDDKFKTQIAKATIIDVDTDKPIAQTMDSSLLVKLQRDRAFAEKVLSQTLDELKKNGSFTSLLSMVAQEAYSLEEENNLMKEELENTATVHALRQELEEHRVESSQLIEEKDLLLAKMKDTFQDKFFGGKMKIKFVQLWERARKEQNSLKYSIEQNGFTKELDQNNYNFDVEQRVHTEIEDYIRQSQTKLEEEIESWMERYDQEIEQRDIDLNYLKQERATHFKQFEDLALLYQHHKNEITEYLEKKEIKEKKRLHELMLYNMATRIQAWWRGIMVRHHLGPFRKKKGKGKGKDKKGKGKKK